MATKKRSNKRVNYAEFLAWLEGVESMQEDNWVPSATQWKTIREKLNTVKPDVAAVKAVERTVASAQPDQYVSPGPLTTMGPSAFEERAQPVPVPSAPMPLNANLNRGVASEHEGVPAANNGPFLNADGTLPANYEFL